MWEQLVLTHMKGLMQFTLTPLKILLVIISLLTCISSHAIDSKAIEEEANSTITELYHTLNNMPNSSMADRIDWISGQFKGNVYILGSLGEGPDARYDQFPKYRVDGFDCDTYVNTVLALALGNSLESFQQGLKSIRYKDGNISYLSRNHFTSVDWNYNNQKRGILKDITLELKDQQGNAVAQFANTLINKPGWYAYKTIDTIRLQKKHVKEQMSRLVELKAKGAKLKRLPSKLPYIPLTALFSKNEPNLFLFSQIPQGAIIEIVRPNWDLRQKIGTSLDISHMGFAIWNKNVLYFRQASSQYAKIVDTPLIKYLNEARNSPTIKGINIQIMIPEKPIIHGLESKKL